MKCSNCKSDALYEYRLTRNKSVFYCAKDLPSFLEPRKKAGLLTLTDTHEEEKNSAIAALTSTEVSEETTAPKKKAAKKKAK